MEESWDWEQRRRERLRRKIVEFLIQSSTQLCVLPIVKYAALSLFADRFLPSLHNHNSAATTTFVERMPLKKSWLLQSPIGECNLQLFALISIWISSKIHDTTPLSITSLKSLGDEFITEQHFTTRDFLEAEVVFLQVLNFEIGVSRIAFVFLEDLLIRFREISTTGGLVNFEACMDVMDLLYETEATSTLCCSPASLAAAVLVAAYAIAVPKQQSEFPILSWVKFAISLEEEEVGKLVRKILTHVLNQPVE
ncbi:hypothetical protein Syun_021874 [Stephania yunnanensis]|uniref:Cyclin N-terminal domain-containing protein n=1 Tax=Stephania yunnanensis TaxID=152371 RepID=A0AAP0IGT0_9MAGN